MNEITMLTGVSKNMPFNILSYPNSENIRPPKSEKIRVVEPSTRSSINMDVLKEFYDKQEIWLSIIKDLRIRAYFAQATAPGKPSGGTVDLTV